MIFHDRTSQSENLLGEPLFKVQHIQSDVGAKRVHFRADVGDIVLGRHLIADVSYIDPHIAEEGENEIFRFGHKFRRVDPQGRRAKAV
jgi:hypothetical protein